MLNFANNLGRNSASLRYAPPPSQSASLIASPSSCGTPSNRHLLSQFDHHIRHLYVIIGLIFDRDLENNVPLMFRYRFLADRLDQLAKSILQLVPQIALINQRFAEEG